VEVRARRWLDVAIQGLPFAVVAALVPFMVEREGGFAVTVWYPIGLGVLALLVVLQWATRQTVAGLSRTALTGVALYAAFVAWGFATIAWAAVRGDAWDGANRALLYLLVLLLLAGWSLTARVLWPLLLGLGLAVCTEGIITTEHVIGSGDQSQFLIGPRLSEPLGYPNATAALFMVMVWLLVGLASRPWLPAWARGIAFGLASMNLTLNLLTQSRGSLYTLPFVGLVYLLLVPGRLRSLAAAALLGVGFLPAAAPVLRVYGTAPDELAHAYRRAIDVGLVWAAILAVAGVMFAAVDDRLRLSPHALRRIGLAVVGAGALAVLALVLALQPWRHVGPAWHSFKYAGEPGGADSRFGGLGSNRYDFWRVGLIEFRRHPVQGIGVDNFLVPYLQQRRSPEQPAYPHSLAIDLLSQTGLVGTVLFIGFAVAVLLAVCRMPPGREADVARVLLVGASVWLLHAQVDWLWEMPVLGVLGLGLVGAALGLTPRRTRPAPVPRPRSRTALLAAPAALGAAVAAATLAFPWLAAREVQAASATWHDDPERAFRQLDRARGLNPFTDQADLLAGAIASRLHRYPLAREKFRQAVERSPDDWYANLELGVVSSVAGPPELAASSLRRALALDPADAIVRSVHRDYAAGRRIDPDAVDRAFEAES
jgi:hypothetical protein